ncbi:hypothetical protein FisN_9Lh247 [Fistulifera solaris]|uniref:Uncharacterized protein n=1 Tax=Fistulifera solaris TaxID=1519565 RepID=A0A1Z5KLE2_FISSO|nr:hypothetical protein FisN_9Lh247 [Fistulifera solaris]|eukprot:GAX26945.1 hypothetical protein FisN_9Lh247 [Fistulifera solaris]
MKAAIVLLSFLTAQAFMVPHSRVRGRTSIALESSPKGSSSNNNKKKKNKSKSKTSTTSSKTAKTAKATVVKEITTPSVSTATSSKLRGTTDDAPQYFAPRHVDERLLGDLTGGRPGAIIETEEQLAIKARIEQEIVDKKRSYKGLQNYGNLEQDEKAQFDSNDPDAIDADALGTWTIQDLRSRFDYEWDPLSGEMDPNIAAMNQENVQYLEETEKNEDGVEIGYDPIFGPSNPVDTRAILGSRDSFMIDARTKDDSMVPQRFPKGDPEIQYNEDVVQFRKSLEVMETYVDPFLPDMEIPRHVARWHGYPEQMYFEPKEYTNNRFTDPQDKTDFDALDPHRARVKAVELARAKNAEWMPEEVSLAWHQQQRAPYEKYQTLVGTLRKGECDPEIVESIQTALNILGSSVELLSIDTHDEGSVFRFHYHGLMKNKFGMKCWTETLIEDCGVKVSGVVFETGFRKRDPAYDGGDKYFGF